MEAESVTVGDANDESLYNSFVSSHENQLRTLGIPHSKWKRLFEKLSRSMFDAGEDFLYSREEISDNSKDHESVQELRVYTKSCMDFKDEDGIYLIDHAWTYTLDTAKQVLKGNSGLLARMCSIMNISCDSQDNSETIDTVLREMWKYNNSYIVQQDSQTKEVVRCWFIMDEFGSRIKYSENPSFIIAPFFYLGDNLMYSLLYPKCSVSEGEEVTIQFPLYRPTQSDDLKSATKLPWQPCDLSHLDYSQCEPDPDYFASGRHIELLPENKHDLPSLSHKEKILVYTEYPEVSEFVSNPRFWFTSDQSDAHILWLAHRLSDYRELTKSRSSLFYVNQFPSEQVLINKDLLAVVCRRSSPGDAFNEDALESLPSWMPTTYNLATELPKFVSFYQSRENRGLDNTWICKPFNLARGMEIYISDDLIQIIRLSEIRPMIACKYVADPVLFPVKDLGLVKMDLRFIVLLKSITDFELFVYDRFWIRFANKPFSMHNFEDYEKHFTVMNYNNFKLRQMFCDDFIKQFEDFYDSYKWKDIESKIHRVIKDVFISSALREPPAGIGSYVGSRAMYGLDMMLQWDRMCDVPEINPVILEVNWMPDCKRACKYYPEFYDDVFSVLFLNETEGKHFVQL